MTTKADFNAEACGALVEAPLLAGVIASGQTHHWPRRRVPFA
jgi:hypothetical protein